LFFVLAGKDGLGGIDRPGDGQIGIVPQHAAFAGGRVERRHLVKDNRVAGQRAETVREARRNVKLGDIVIGQNGADVTPERRGLWPEIDGDVENFALKNADKLCLGVGRLLKMKPAYRSDEPRKGLVFLNEPDGQPQFLHFFFVRDFSHIAAIVLVDFGTEELDVGNLQFLNGDHLSGMCLRESPPEEDSPTLAEERAALSMTPPLTSVIMVSYHTGPVLDRAIAAVLAQSAPVELVLVNNGNPPDVEDQLKAKADAGPGIRFLTGQGNVGFAKGCNLGARNAQGDCLLFLNPDSLLPPDAVERLHGHAAKLKRPCMLGARLLDEKGKDQRGCRRALLTPKTAFVEALHLQKYFPEHRLNYHEAPVPADVTPMPAISGAFMFLHKDDFWRIKGFDEDYFLHVEDMDFCLRFRRAEGEIYFVPDIAVTHIGATSKVTSLFLEKNKARGFIRYFHENFGHAYPQFVLWALDAAIMARLGVIRALAFLEARKSAK